MSASANNPSTPPTVVGGFPPTTFPVLFADGVTSVSNSHEIVKFYLARIDPNFAGGTDSHQQAFAQIIMPMSSFVNTALFFQVVLDQLVTKGDVTQAMIDANKPNLTQAEPQNQGPD